jgi:hypothetical protein
MWVLMRNFYLAISWEGVQGVRTTFRQKVPFFRPKVPFL